jgi:hypothetical protein
LIFGGKLEYFQSANFQAYKMVQKSAIENVCSPLPNSPLCICIYTRWTITIQLQKLVHNGVTRDRCYNHNFRRFLTIFGENILKIITSVPDWAHFRPMSDHWLWAVFDNYRTSPNKFLGYFFQLHKTMYVLIWTKIGLATFWAIFHWPTLVHTPQM